MTNVEVMAVDQDQLVKGARRVSQNERLEVWARPLADGRTAIGLFNRGLHAAKMSLSWKDLGLTGQRIVRDLWAQKNLGTFANEFSATVPAHGTVLVAVAARAAAGNGR
jgi:alpha-galactosidase